ncbi:MAG: peptidoglycan DD-metalloendopeptidase family protein [bacterium]
MVKLKLNITVIIFCVVPLVLIIAQSGSDIKKNQSDLKTLQSEISGLEKELNQKNRAEYESVKTIEKINKQNLLLSKRITALINEEKSKEYEIGKLSKEISEIENEMSSLKTEYAKYIVWIYKNGQPSFLKYIINSQSFEQAVLRYKYLSYITEKNEKLINDLKKKVRDMNSLKADLVNEQEEKLRLVEEQKNDKAILEKRKSEKESILNNLREDQRSIEIEIEEKRLAEIKIKNMITKLIEEERTRETKLREQKFKNEKITSLPSHDYGKLENFQALMGNMNWPVEKGSIARNFGEHKNDKLQTVTLNYGIDIETESGSIVKAVAEGYISVIEWIPGYGSVIILTHKNNYRTVYGHVSDIRIAEGTKVNAGSTLGKVNDSLEGTILHFEIWNERNYQNPEEWLARK